LLFDVPRFDFLSRLLDGYLLLLVELEADDYDYPVTGWIPTD